MGWLTGIGFAWRQWRKEKALKSRGQVLLAELTRNPKRYTSPTVIKVNEVDTTAQTVNAEITYDNQNGPAKALEKMMKTFRLAHAPLSLKQTLLKLNVDALELYLIQQELKKLYPGTEIPITLNPLSLNLEALAQLEDFKLLKAKLEAAKILNFGHPENFKAVTMAPSHYMNFIEIVKRHVQERDRLKEKFNQTVEKLLVKTNQKSCKKSPDEPIDQYKTDKHAIMSSIHTEINNIHQPKAMLSYDQIVKQIKKVNKYLGDVIFDDDNKRKLNARKPSCWSCFFWSRPTPTKCMQIILDAQKGIGEIVPLLPPATAAVITQQAASSSQPQPQ